MLPGTQYFTLDSINISSGKGLTLTANHWPQASETSQKQLWASRAETLRNKFISPAGLVTVTFASPEIFWQSNI